LDLKKIKIVFIYFLNKKQSMIEINSGNTNNLIYFSRYNQVDKFEIYDHQTNITVSGATLLTGMDGKIQHTGITFTFLADSLYTYYAYYFYIDTYYLCTQQLLRTWKNEERLDTYTSVIKDKQTFKIKK
jgi:hypothetical protein